MIIITGASRGIGKYLLHTFIQNESNIIGIYHETKPEKYLNKYYKADVVSYLQIESLFKGLIERLEGINLINCAGITYNAFMHKSDPDIWRKVIETNLIGTFNVIRVLLPIMRKQKYGRIINFSSVVGLKPTPGVSAYAASKAALWGLTKSVASENATLNVTINNINLGYSELGMIGSVPEQFKNNIISQIPTGRLCTPQNIFNTVNYLINTSYITGTSIDLNGGLI